MYQTDAPFQNKHLARFRNKIWAIVCLDLSWNSEPCHGCQPMLMVALELVFRCCVATITLLYVSTVTASHTWGFNSWHSVKSVCHISKALRPLGLTPLDHNGNFWQWRHVATMCFASATGISHLLASALAPMWRDSCSWGASLSVHTPFASASALSLPIWKNPLTGSWLLT